MPEGKLCSERNKDEAQETVRGFCRRNRLCGVVGSRTGASAERAAASHFAGSAGKAKPMVIVRNLRRSYSSKRTMAQLMKKEKYAFPACIELEYPAPEASDVMKELAKRVQ